VEFLCSGLASRLVPYQGSLQNSTKYQDQHCYVDNCQDTIATDFPTLRLLLVQFVVGLSPNMVTAFAALGRVPREGGFSDGLVMAIPSTAHAPLTIIVPAELSSKGTLMSPTCLSVAFAPKGSGSLSHAWNLLRCSHRAEKCLPYPGEPEQSSPPVIHHRPRFGNNPCQMQYEGPDYVSQQR
jgi:hypothetical protein